jgi:hypothetical protein
MVELKRREKKSNSEEHLQVSFDHIWPGSEARYCARTDQEHPDRGERCSRALGSLSPFRSTWRRRSSRPPSNTGKMVDDSRDVGGHVREASRPSAQGNPSSRRLGA